MKPMKTIECELSYRYFGECQQFFTVAFSEEESEKQKT